MQSCVLKFPLVDTQKSCIFERGFIVIENRKDTLQANGLGFKFRCAQFSPVIGDVHERSRHYMIRKAFVMQVNPDQHEEYRERHNPIWPELEAILKAHGIHNYSIFLHPQTSQLFAYVEIEDEVRWQSIAQTNICRKWWTHMREIMPSNPDNSPKSSDLQEVFHLD